MYTTQQEKTPVKETCDNCHYHGKMHIKRGRYKVLMYCPKCGHVAHKRKKI